MECRFLYRNPFLKLFNRCLLLNLKRNEHQLSVKIEVLQQPQKPLSTLYVSGRHGGDVYQIVKPLIDVKFISGHIDTIGQSCHLRGLDFDLKNIVSLLCDWETLRDKYAEIVQKDREFITELKRLKSLDLTLQFESLQKEHFEFLVYLKTAKEKLHDIEDQVMPIMQMIPNSVDPLTPLQEDTFSVKVEPSEKGFASASHTEIGTNMGLLTFSDTSPTAYYLSGCLSQLEFALQLYFSDRLKALDFAQLSCVDFCKSFIAEAVGSDPHSKNDCIPLQGKNVREMAQKQILMGGASFETFCAYFVNMNIGKSSLTAKYFSQGRSYDAKYRKIKSPDLFSTVQSSNVHCLVLCEGTNENAEFNQLFELIASCYSEFDIPFRIVDVAANNLNMTESRRKRLELWSPSQYRFVPVAHVSMRRDFISKRLHITYGVEHAVEGYCSIVEGVVVNSSVLIGCIVENFQKPDQTFDFSCIHKFLHDYID